MSAPAFDVSIAIDWLGTFAVHSTLALGTAWLVSASLRQRALALQETLLRSSLWLALVSASVQCSLRSVWTPELVLSPDRDAPVPFGLVVDVAAEAPGTTASAGSAPAWWAALPWSVWALLAAGAATACGLGWLFVVHRRLRRVLRARRPETDSRVLTTASEVARALGLQQSPHISRSEAIATPIAFGSVRPEICLPVRVGELSAQSLRAMLAHEVAHLRAADPTWMWGAAWLQALFPWQFLFAVVRRRWARLVELRCDAIAAEHATPTAVARCLLDVADWLRPGPEGSLAALGMAARPSALRERVEAALHGRSRRPVRRCVSRALGGLALTALTAGAPAVATEGALGGVLTPAALLSALPTDEGVRSLDRNALRRMSSALQGEHARVVAEAERLRAELRTLLPTPELTGMQATLDRRLADLSKLRTRLDALLAHTDSTDR